MLTGVVIRDFKSYSSAYVPLSTLTVLIGANASGKSNAIEALRLLSFIAEGNRLNSIRYAGYEGEAAVRGTVSALGYCGKKSFTLGCTIGRREWNRLEVTLKIDSDDDLHIRNETIIGGFESSAPLYEVIGTSSTGSDIRVAYNNFARGGKKPQVTCSDQTAVFNQLRSAARFDTGHKVAQRKIPEVCADFAETLSDIIFLDPQPHLMRSYSFKSESVLRGDGANLSGVLWNLCSSSRTKTEVLELIRSLPEQNIADIQFIETPRGEVMVQLAETFGGGENQTDATLLSDGTLRVLSIAAALMSAPMGALVVIEEVDNGIHPSRAENLLSSILMIAEKRELRVLISSHNPALLDALPGPALNDVVFCYRDPKSGASKVVRLSDLQRYPQLAAQGTLGHLLTQGLIDKFVKSEETKGERLSRNRDWLRKVSV